SGLITTEAGGSASFTARLATQPTTDVTLPLVVSPPAEGRLSTSNLAFTTANWDSPQTVTVTGVDDAADDGDIAYSIVVGSAVSSDPTYSGLKPSDVSLTNIDDDLFTPTSFSNADDFATRINPPGAWRYGCA